MNATLKEVLLQKCRKKVIPLHDQEEEEEEESRETSDEESQEDEASEELPLEDILAEKRRKYNAKEEFIFLLYNDLLKYFVKEWDGKILRKKLKKKIDDHSKDSTSEENKSTEEIHDYEHVIESGSKDSNFKRYNEDNSELNSRMFWKLTLPDEFANIKFINNNTYSGRISRKMMEGEGVYRCSNGAQYKGEFQQNRMHGKGLLEWSSDCWYEGDFVNGFRHGRGIMVDGENRYMYTGQWHMGQKHGKGYCRYGNNGSYDGDWMMDKMNGVGLRIYPSGARYVGQWTNGLRDGVGTMVWTNGNVYRGEWRCGSMHGYGEYVWNGFFNKTFTWPQEASYVGYWRNGMRHGEGELKLNAVGGAKYVGYWKDNKKHGYGLIIGSNGERFESDSLFLNDVLCAYDTSNGILKNEVETKDETECELTAKEVEPVVEKKSDELERASITPVLKPEQFPSLSYHITRLLDPKSLEEPLVPSVSSGKCYSCENESCTCLALSSTDINEQVASEEGVSMRATDISTTEETMESRWNYEERWTYNCLMLHMARLRQIYQNYATLFAATAPECNLAMSRLCLWQLWRDCGIHKKGLNLIEIDNYIAKNETALVKDSHHPFEKIEIWQFLHSLLEVSWHLYTKHDDIEGEEINGKLASGLQKLLKNDIYPHAGKHVGNLCQEYQDLLPMHSVFELYKQIGYPFSAKDLLRMMCVLKGTTDPQPFSTTDEAMKNLPNGINSITIGGKVSYLLKFDEIFSPPRRTAIEVSENSENDSSHGLLVFRQLGISKLIEIITLICPAIKDASSNIIINMDYELTFLEFYEIILEATRQLLSSKKEAEKESQTNKIEAENALQNNNLQGKDTSRTNRRSLARKGSKVKNRI